MCIIYIYHLKWRILMDETKKSGMDELMEAYEEDRERRSVREDELQAAKER